MFFLRCAFFLSIVYVSIALGAGSLRSPHAFEAAVASEASDVATAAVAHASDWCAERPARCARDAARLTSLVQTTASEPAFDGDDTLLADAEGPHAPLPVPDPRRHHARVVLTEAR